MHGGTADQFTAPKHASRHICDVKLEQQVLFGWKTSPGFREEHLDNTVPEVRILPTNWEVPTVSEDGTQSAEEHPVQNNIAVRQPGLIHMSSMVT